MQMITWLRRVVVILENLNPVAVRVTDYETIGALLVPVLFAHIPLDGGMRAYPRKPLINRCEVLQLKTQVRQC